MIRAVGTTCGIARSRYIEIQDDLPEEWSLTSAFKLFGSPFGGAAPAKIATPALDPEVAKERFSKL
jgi:hypothetical protein